jgi:hypothetical protein
MTETTTMVTPEMEQFKGVWVNEEVSLPVTESDIRRWAIAVYWPHKPPPLFWDSAYAATTKWGGIVAPEDFSPFAWPVPTGEAVNPSARLPGFLGRVVLNGGQTDTYGVRIRPGDVISTRTCLSDWEEKEAKSGRKLFSYYRAEWRNQNGELVRTRVATTIQF